MKGQRSLFFLVGIIKDTAHIPEEGSRDRTKSNYEKCLEWEEEGRGVKPNLQCCPLLLGPAGISLGLGFPFCQVKG